MSEWISAEDRLPDIKPGMSQCYEKLVYCPHIEMIFLARCNALGNWKHFNSDKPVAYKVSHWMELPPPPL